MKVTLDPRAADELASQIDYLIDNHALLAAARLKARCDAFFESSSPAIRVPASTSPR
jgi:hypothetical protein